MATNSSTPARSDFEIRSARSTDYDDVINLVCDEHEVGTDTLAAEYKGILHDSLRFAVAATFGDRAAHSLTHAIEMSGKIRKSEFVIRPARPTDFDDVMNLVQGLYFGTDTLPAEYHRYLDDPHKVYYVAVYRGKLVAFTGGRVTDNGETFEPGGSRTHSQFQKLGLYQLVRERLINESVLRKWPHLERIRMVTSAVEEVKNKPHIFSIIPHSQRVAMILLRAVPKDTFLSTVHTMEHSALAVTTATVQRATREDVHTLFTDASAGRHIFPSGLIVKDSETFTIGPRYLSNIPSLMEDYGGGFYVSNGSRDDGQKCKSTRAISFGTGVEANVSLDVLRYCIDYYGEADFETLVEHFRNHMRDLKQCLQDSKTSTLTTIQLFLPVNVYESEARVRLQQFVGGIQSLGQYCVGAEYSYTQVACHDIRHPHRFVNTGKHKM